MKAVIFGATGMLGQSVLRECLRDQEIEEVLTIGRGSTGLKDKSSRNFRSQTFSISPKLKIK